MSSSLSAPIARRRGGPSHQDQHDTDALSEHELDERHKARQPHAHQFPSYEQSRLPIRPGNKWNKLIAEGPGGKGSVNFDIVVRELRNHACLFIYTALSLFTHMWRIGENNSVVWDEAHFGKFGAYYLNRTFYFDVHPPLGKMLVGFAGALSGFNGAYDFPSGQTYPPHVPFKMMRVLMALPGVMMVPLAWGTTGAMGMSKWARHLVTTMVLCDIAWTVITRFILLDSLLLFFTIFSIFCLTMFHTCQNIPFDEEWWIWLILTGVGLGCTVSVKWVGFCVISVVGLYTVLDLWEKFGDIRMPIRVYIRHWVARIACLIVLPVSIYMLCFKIHFLILDRSGPGDAQMSSLFQAHLRGNTFSQNPLEPVFGSKITLKNMGYGGGLLHSHVQTYPSGSQQQQVTCYHYNDANNEWIITPRWEDHQVNPNGELRYLKDQDVIRLVHKQTGRNLHSHSVVAPVTKLNNEVSCYGNATIGDSNDYWRIHVVDDMLRGRKKYVDNIHSLTTRLRFQHVNSGCWLRAANAVLPQWGFKQVEVSCDKANNQGDEHTYWNVESHTNDRLPPGNIQLYRSPFFRDFWHLNVAMWTSNNALVPDADKEDNLASNAWDWPFLYRGMRMNGWSANSIKYYLIGNPIVWWSGSSSLIIFSISIIWYMARFQRKYNDFATGEWDRYTYIGGLALGGWLLHFIPFVIQRRVLYFHHYLPALYFSVLMVGVMSDHFAFNSTRLSNRFKVILFLLCMLAVVGCFLHFRQCAWGLHGPINNHKWLRWRVNWRIYD